MARFAIELRNARGFASNDVEGYLYEQEQFDKNTGEELNPVLAVKPVATIKNADYIPFWDSKSDARYALKWMPDAFFDRYDADIVEIAEIDN